MIESTENKVSYTCNGQQRVFAFPVRFFAANDIHCHLYDEFGETEIQTFTVTQAADPNDGGTVTLDSAPANGVILTIVRQLDPVQPVSLPTYGKIPSAEVERELDRLTMLIQEVREGLSRCLQVAFGQGDPDLLWQIFNGLKNACAISAENAATSAASAGAIASQIAFIWTELTGDTTYFEAAFATAQELMEARGAMTTAAAALAAEKENSLAAINAASAAALNTARTEIGEAKDSAVNTLNTVVGTGDAAIALKLAEAQGAAQAAQAAQAAAGDSSAAAASAKNAAQTAQTLAEQARTAAGISAGDALAAAQAAAADRVLAQNAAAAADVTATTVANASITAHNSHPDAHNIKFANYALLASPAFSGTPTAPTASETSDSNVLATTAFAKHVYSHCLDSCNLNTVITPGRYFLSSDSSTYTYTHSPISSNIAGFMDVEVLNSDRVRQVVSDRNGITYARCIWNGTAEPWICLSGEVKARSFVKGTAPSVSSDERMPVLYFYDKNGEEYADLEHFSDDTGAQMIRLLVHSNTIGSSASAAINLGVESDGTTFSRAITPSSISNGKDIATTAWVRQFCGTNGSSSLVHMPNWSSASVVYNSTTSNDDPESVDSPQFSGTCANAGWYVFSVNNINKYEDLSGNITLTLGGKIVYTLQNFQHNAPFCQGDAIALPIAAGTAWAVKLVGYWDDNRYGTGLPPRLRILYAPWVS